MACSIHFKTYVFLDVGALGIPVTEFRRMNFQNAHDCKQYFMHYYDLSDPLSFPRMTDIGLIAISSSCMDHKMNEINGMEKKISPLRFHPRSLMAMPINHELTDKQLQEHFHKIKKSPRYNKAVGRRHRTLAEQWPGFQHFFRMLDYPICIVSHNGFYFDFQALLRQFHYININLKEAFIGETCFVDSLHCFQHLDYLFQQDLLKLETDRNHMENWAAAMKKRYKKKYFDIKEEGEIFRKSRFDPSYSLKNLYRTIFDIKWDYKAHDSMHDCEALLQVSIAFGKKFFWYCENFGVDLLKNGNDHE